MSEESKLPRRIQKLGTEHAMKAMPKNPWTEWAKDQIALYEGAYDKTRVLVTGIQPVTTPAGTQTPEPA